VRTPWHEQTDRKHRLFQSNLEIIYVHSAEFIASGNFKTIKYSKNGLAQIFYFVNSDEEI